MCRDIFSLDQSPAYPDLEHFQGRSIQGLGIHNFSEQYLVISKVLILKYKSGIHFRIRWKKFETKASEAHFLVSLFSSCSGIVLSVVHIFISEDFLFPEIHSCWSQMQNNCLCCISTDSFWIEMCCCLFRSRRTLNPVKFHWGKTFAEGTAVGRCVASLIRMDALPTETDGFLFRLTSPMCTQLCVPSAFPQTCTHLVPMSAYPAPAQAAQHLAPLCSSLHHSGWGAESLHRAMGAVLLSPPVENSISPWPHRGIVVEDGCKCLLVYV